MFMVTALLGPQAASRGPGTAVKLLWDPPVTPELGHKLTLLASAVA
ncbi:MAG: hypothetical protein M3Y32_01995 [Pseudomonadota bacterium]|nr:hypothetical protein [Pseudomonadota bacterium]